MMTFEDVSLNGTVQVIPSLLQEDTPQPVSCNPQTDDSDKVAMEELLRKKEELERKKEDLERRFKEIETKVEDLEKKNEDLRKEKEKSEKKNEI